jgi:hypothetical protein
VSILVLIAIGAFIQRAAPNSPIGGSLSSGLSAVVPTASSKAEAAAFASLKTGMSYQQAVAILGSKGQEIVSDEISGVKTVLYEWKDEKSWANKNAVFQNDRLIGKKQFDL